MLFRSESASAHDPRPKRLLVPEHDQYSTPDAVRAKSAHWLTTSVQVVRMADHFLAGQSSEVTALAAAFIRELVAR